MSLRQRLLAMFSLTVLLAVGAVAWIISLRVRDAYEAQERQRTDALVAQFRGEFTRSGAEIAERLQRIARSDRAYEMAFDLTHGGDPGTYLTEASAMARQYDLDLLEIIGPTHAIVSSAQWPARYGYSAPGLSAADAVPFLKQEDLPDDQTAVALYAVRTIGTAPNEGVGEKDGEAAADNVATVLLAGGKKLDRAFLSELSTPAGMQVLLYRNSPAAYSPQSLTSATDGGVSPPAWREIVDGARHAGAESHTVFYPTPKREDSLDVTAIPLKDPRGGVIAVLVIANSRRDLAGMQQQIRRTAYSVAGLGVLFAVGASLWIAARISRPIEQLADAVREVGAGDWDVSVDVRSTDEIGQLAQGFNAMTRQLGEQRERLIQSERVAAWRELARRLAHELKNPLFPLQITVENLVRARHLSATEFDEVFDESTGTLLAELQNLKNIVGRFSDFSRMPSPELEPADIRDGISWLVALYKPALEARSINLSTALGDAPLMAMVDTELLHRALSNLVLNAMDAMDSEAPSLGSPPGGRLTISAAQHIGCIEIRIADTGAGLTPEECVRLFTPYYTTKQHGTGLGLAVVQSIIADHHGSISVQNAAGGGAEFVIELPAAASSL